mmetsp:Transcript_17737/g.27392  ORF Transcript_17737/g.27392 Transcript_17737/m.27392 type:complete len:256 (-) Transcript_17737:53-820(-)
MQPLLYIVKRLLIRYIIDDDNPMRTAVIRRGNSTETFLSCCIPDLQLDSLSVKLNSADFEINSNGRDVGFSVGIICEPKQQTRFSDAGVSNKEQFEKVVAVEWNEGQPCENYDLRTEKSGKMEYCNVTANPLPRPLLPSMERSKHQRHPTLFLTRKRKRNSYSKERHDQDDTALAGIVLAPCRLKNSTQEPCARSRVRRQCPNALDIAVFSSLNSIALPFSLRTSLSWSMSCLRCCNHLLFGVHLVLSLFCALTD